MLNHLETYINNMISYQSINLIYYSGTFIISVILITILLNNWFEFRRMRVVMSSRQLIMTIITIISLCLEPLFNNADLGYRCTTSIINIVVTPTAIIGIIGILICGIANCRVNHRIWRTEFPTRPYPNDLRG